VIRGPETKPGPKLLYAPDTYATFFGRSDVAVFSSRSVCSAAMMDAAPQLRAIVNPTVGLETVDVTAASARSILVGHAVMKESRTALAEATVMLILMQMYQPLRTQEVMFGTRPRPAILFEKRWARILEGHTVGLVGFGRIAREVAKRLSTFGVRLLVTGRPGAAAQPSDTPEYVERVDLDTLLRESDIVSLHITVTPESDGLIGRRELALMKPHAHLINTARGEAVDEAALCEALVNKRLGGAALDCFRIEPLPADSPLWGLENVFLTPHLVAQTRDSAAVLPKTAFENITRALRGEPPLHCKNPEVIPAWRERVARLERLLLKE